MVRGLAWIRLCLWLLMALSLPSRAGVQAAPPGQVALSRAPSLASHHYVEEEFTLTGQAQTYARKGEWRRDGRWSVVPQTTRLPFATRMLVRRPADPSRFNGMVVMEWMNTTLGFDLDAIWSFTHAEIMREGYIWIGVSSEVVGIEGLKKFDAARYGASQMNSNDASFDLFSQAGLAVRRQPQLLLKRGPDFKMLAGAYSQSALFLHTYINAIQPIDQVFDGFLLHGRAPVAVSVVTGESTIFDPAIRSDLKAPVIQIQSEMEVTVSWPLSKTQDTDKVRYWEVAGAAHFDQHLQDDAWAVAPKEFGSDRPECLKPISTLPTYEVDQAALHALRMWINQGQTPPNAERLQRNFLGFVKHDEQGLPLGGLRLPEVSAPVATYGMYSNFTTGPFSKRNMFACVAGGSTQAMAGEQLRALYPSRSDYLRQFQAASEAAENAGFLRPADHEASITRARLMTWPE